MNEAQSYVASLQLNSFRSYARIKLFLENGPIVFTGPNGAGKTNILEAVSLLSPGRGLRKAKQEDLRNLKAPHQPWGINSTIQTASDLHRINVAQDSTAISRKLVQINGTISAQPALQEYVRLIWLTPFMDQIFLESPSDKRRFIDNLVGTLEINHSKNVSQLEQAVKERNKLFKERRTDPLWFKSIEKRIATLSLSIVKSRLHYFEALNQEMTTPHTSFPQAYCAMDGFIESVLNEIDFAETVELLVDKLAQTRSQDALNYSTSIGAHQSHFSFTHKSLARRASLCSTGEQKALLLSILLSHVRIISKMKSMKPVLLLDEIVAHIDMTRRQELFHEIKRLKMQVWMTGTDEDTFSPLKSGAQFFKVDTLN